ncbi:hypothetical protein MKW92_004551 [Papaver armeniacum]|nr:hypothetical protein MKW92_029679 [Papaver armeniacum]KAI3956730.1 hypothetical protein MKW92_004550 [Papaver armeniacum]KAI3956731.1 hypothetical protein MKW92_004551 [Papaver armeniacum]
MPYPPCVSFPGVRRVTWPQLLGKPAAVAKATIERERPGVTAVIIPVNEARTEDFCSNRVWLDVNNDPQRTVATIPMIG